jgi:hypothetical protein
MYTVWHVDKYKITFKLVIDHWPMARYRAAARRLTLLYKIEMLGFGIGSF